MSFEEYFCLNGLEQSHQYINFAMGLAPKGFHRDYLIDLTRLDFMNKRGPSTAMGINLCAGVIGTEVVKILISRGKVYYAPYYQVFDAFTNQWSTVPNLTLITDRTWQGIQEITTNGGSFKFAANGTTNSATITGLTPRTLLNRLCASAS